MRKNKGFTIIELMITVAIIGILSLMALPMYSNYIKKVRLTEVLLKHSYLTRQLEIEFIAGGAEAVYSYIMGTCSNATVAGVTAMCTTSIGLSTGTAVITSGNNTTTLFIMPTNQTNEEYNMQYFSFSNESGKESILYHFPKKSNNDNNPAGQRSGYGFVFVQQLEGVADSKRLKITTNNSGTYLADFNRWYCGGTLLKNTSGEIEGRIPKPIRPNMCKFTSPDGYASPTIFLED